MSITQLPSGMWRAQVYHRGKNVSVGTFATKREAKAAREKARGKLVDAPIAELSVMDFWKRWTTDALFRRPKDSTNLHNAERTKAFAERHATVPLAQVGDEIVGQWLAGGQRNGTVPALRAMFNDAASAKAGRLITDNPFARLGIRKTRGNRDKQPPTQDVAWELIGAACKHTLPSFAAWLQVACFTGMRPGELDALRWTSVDLKRGIINVLEQFNARTGTFTLPKNGLTREAVLTPPARDALMALPREGAFCFVNLRGDHWTASARAYHWKATRAATDFEGSLYLATRHHAGWYMVNVLRLDSEDVAFALGHEDGGEQVRRLYGHRERDDALRRVADAYAGRSNVLPLTAVEREVA